MKRHLILILILLIVPVAVHGQSQGPSEGLFAEMETSKGRMLFQLRYAEAPLAVANFIGLAEGKMEWIDASTGRLKMAPFYNGLTFHKVVARLTIHGGDPKGTGQGGPGYLLDREINPSLSHDGPGILSMLNDGEYAHGSQFFITLGPATFLDGRHTIFGEVVDGLDVLKDLERGDRILRVKILRKGAQAEAFDVSGLLDRIRRRAGEIHTQITAARAKARSRGAERTRHKELPKLSGKIDPDRLPQKDQPEADKVALEYILLTFRGALTPKEYQVYEQAEAAKAAEHLVQAARTQESDFAGLAQRYSDSPEYRIRLLTKGGDQPDNLAPVFRLKEGQVSDPILTTKGYMIFKRVPLELIKVRHILIAYQGAEGSIQSRTKEEARDLAEAILKRAETGEDFGNLARTYSDSESGKKGGFIGEIARGMTVPSFEDAAFALKGNEISEVTPTPAGFQIIQRIE